MSTKPPSADTSAEPAPLAETQLDRVGGGFSLADLKPVGCLPCTSGGGWDIIGRYSDLVVNPVVLDRGLALDGRMFGP